MLTSMIRRVAITSVLVTAFVGSGLLFGQVRPAPGAGNSLEIAVKIAEPTINVGELNVSINNRPARSRAFDWPFFSFRKGAR